MDIVVNEEHVQLLISMGFLDDFEVRRALRLTKNDINEAVSFLTNEVPGLHDVEMTVPLPSSSNDNYQTSTTTDAGTENMEIDDTLEFPATQLYKLGRCLNASIRLAKERLTESDENCRRFLENCMPACFDKLMTAYQVNRWGQEVQEGIFQMLQLFIDLICLRLQYDPVPTRMMDVLSLCLDPNTNYHQKNSRKLWDKAQWESEFGYGNVFAESSSQFIEAYGYLISLINRFAAKGGFDQMVKKFESKTLAVFEMFFILKPFGFCVDFLNAPIAGPVLRPCIDFVIENFPTLSDIDGKKGTSSSSLVDLMGYVKILLVHLHKSPEEANRVDDLRLSFVLKLLKSSNFSLRMNALKELTKLLEMLTSPNIMDERLSIGSDKLSQWLSNNEVLSLALEGYIDQAQYYDRLRTLLVFLGPRLSIQDVTKIWSLRRGHAAITVDNVHTIVTQAATKFGRQELDHLLSLIQKSWNGEGERSKEKLVILLGKIGLDTSVSYTYEQIAEILWKFAHQKISIALMNMCLEEHLKVATVSGRDTLRLDYINRCMNDIEKGSFVLPAMTQLHGLVESIKKSGFNAAKSQKSVISNLVNKCQLVESLFDNLIRMHNLSFQMWQQKTKTIIAAQPISLPPTTLQTVSSANTSSLTVQNLSIQMPGSNIPLPDQCKVEVELEQEFGPDFLLPNGFTYGYHVDAILEFLRFVLVAGELFLLIHRCQELWDMLIADSNACSYAREAGFLWFLEGINDLEKNCQMQLFQDRMLKLDPMRYTSTGFVCFRRFFESVNKNEQKRLSSYSSQSTEVEKPDLIGSDYLWQMSLNITNDDITKEAIDFLISLNYVHPTFDMFRCCAAALESMVRCSDNSVTRMTIAIISILAAKIPTELRSKLGTSHTYMKFLLHVVNQKVDMQTNWYKDNTQFLNADPMFKQNAPPLDITLKFTLYALWDLTDESPATCLCFLDECGLDVVLKVLDVFREHSIETKVLGLLNNVAEVSDLKERLVNSACLGVIFCLLKSSKIDVSYFSAGILAHLCADIKWENFEPSWQSCLDSLEFTISQWRQHETVMVTYRSFKPFFSLLSKDHLPAVQLWAVWAIRHVCLKNISANHYVDMFKMDGGQQALERVRIATQYSNPMIGSICDDLLKLLA